jgi:hypothetical protein
LQSSQEAIQPGSRVRLRQCQAQKEAPRCTSHRRHIAYRPRQRFPAHGIRRVLAPREVRPLKEPIACQNHLATGLWRKQRCVITNSQRDRTSREPARWDLRHTDSTQDRILGLRSVFHRPMRTLQSTLGRQYIPGTQGKRFELGHRNLGHPPAQARYPVLSDSVQVCTGWPSNSKIQG